MQWNELSTDEKVEQLRKSQAQWSHLLVPRLGEIREVIEAQERLIARLMRRIVALEQSAQTLDSRSIAA